MRSGSFNSTTGIQQNSGSGQLTVYPNPATSVVRILNDQPIEEIIITNVMGQIVFQSRPDTKKVSVNIETAGVYFVSVTGNKQTRTKVLTIIQ
jgi:hypothetical protein